MYINNRLRTRETLGVRGGLGDKEKGSRYQHVHKQPDRVYLFRGHRGDLGLGGDLGTRRRGVGINMHVNHHLGFIMYINNHLGFILFRGHWGGLGDKEKGSRYQNVHKQPFRVYLFRTWGGLGVRGTWGQGEGE